MIRVIITAAACLCLLGSTSNAWVYSEHRDITVAAVMRLKPTYRMQLDSIWRWARVGYEHRLPASVVIPELPEQPNYIDWGAWPAIAGDHSCSSERMLHNIARSDWILSVARVTERFKRKLAAAPDLPTRLNALRDQDMQLQLSDPDYATRAGSNNVHFMLSRALYTTSLDEYLESVLAQGAEINAFAVYTWYHYRAMAKVRRLRDATLTADMRSNFALAALADEAFALHFLQDMYAAGHVAGTWGDASLRKGTHDYYNEHGYETTDWTGKIILLMGDSNMRKEDIDVPARAVRSSIEQFLDAYLGTKAPYDRHTFDDADVSGLDLNGPDTLNVCASYDVPGMVMHGGLREPILQQLELTPMPALREGLGQLPRFRAELGGFVGIAPNLRLSGWNDEFDATQSTAFGIGSLGLNVRFGLGLDGITSEADDGLVFAEFGIAHDDASFASTTVDSVALGFSNSVAAIPARSSYSVRLRMPFFLVPGDLLLGALLIAPFSTDLYAEMAVNAVSGGVIPWQAGIATSVGRFQFVLGREIGVSLYGYGANPQRILLPYVNTEGVEVAEILELRSVKVELPVLEWRLFRTFSSDQSSSLLMQFYGAADVPVSWKSYLSGPSNFDPHTRYGLGLRMVFDWRHYL